MAQIDPVELRTVLTPYFVSKREFYSPFIMWPLAISAFQSLPALRGFWLGGQYEGSSGVHELADISGCGQNLTETGNPPTGHTANGAVYSKFTGSNWYSDADSVHWDITGTETGTLTAQRGITIGAWVYFGTTASAVEYILCKGYGGSEISYVLRREATGEAQFYVSVDGTATTAATSVASMASAGWYFVVGRFDPSTEVSVFLNGVEAINTTSIPASIYAGAADLFMAGRDDGATPGLWLMDGNISMAFICAAYINDYSLIRLYELSRIAFGVD